MKRTFWKRAAAGVLTAVMALSLTVGGKETVEAASEEEKNAVVLTVDGVDFTAEEYAVSFLYNQNRLDSNAVHVRPADLGGRDRRGRPSDVQR